MEDHLALTLGRLTFYRVSQHDRALVKGIGYPESRLAQAGDGVASRGECKRFATVNANGISAIVSPWLLWPKAVEVASNAARNLTVFHSCFCMPSSSLPLTNSPSAAKRATKSPDHQPNADCISPQLHDGLLIELDLGLGGTSNG